MLNWHEKIGALKKCCHFILISWKVLPCWLVYSCQRIHLTVHMKAPRSFETPTQSNATGWTAADRISEWTRFSAPTQTGPRAHPASCTMGTGIWDLWYRDSFPGVKRPARDANHPPLSSAEVIGLELYFYWAFLDCPCASFNFHMGYCPTKPESPAIII